MKLAITQPNYLPWLGYFNLLSKVDLWVVLDNVQLANKSFVTRNKVVSLDGRESWLSVSLEKADRRSFINERKISFEHTWWEAHINKMNDYYKKTPYYKDYIDVIASIIKPLENDTLATYNTRSVIELCELLGISIEYKFASDIIPNLEGGPGEKILSLCSTLKPTKYYNFKAGVDMGFYSAEDFNKINCLLYKQEYQHPQYEQHTSGFVDYMSVVDLIFNEGNKAIEIINKGDNWVLIKD